ncbi:MAG: beta-lactamase domain protein [Dehalococcoidia bacterium]|nr:beta-lactamase domain protein [Dehalococcoidia bacterium]
MKLTALGTSAAYPGAGGACSGWLVEEGSTRLLVDCGTGVLSSLQRHIPIPAITAILITHIHADHFLDLIPLRYALKYGLPPEERSSPILYLPPGSHSILKGMFSHLDPAPNTFFSDAFQVREYKPRDTFAIGDLTVETAPVVHYIPSHAVAVYGSGKAVFSSDTGPCEALVELAKGADIMVCEATYLSEDEDFGDLRGHLTAKEAGEIARRAGVKRLIITHLWPRRDRQQVLAIARESFGGDVELAEEGKSYVP